MTGSTPVSAMPDSDVVNVFPKGQNRRYADRAARLWRAGRANRSRRRDSDDDLSRSEFVPSNAPPVRATTSRFFVVTTNARKPRIWIEVEKLAQGLERQADTFAKYGIRGSNLLLGERGLGPSSRESERSIGSESGNSRTKGIFGSAALIRFKGAAPTICFAGLHPALTEGACR